MELARELFKLLGAIAQLIFVLYILYLTVFTDRILPIGF